MPFNRFLFSSPLPSLRALGVPWLALSLAACVIDTQVGDQPTNDTTAATSTGDTSTGEPDPTTTAVEPGTSTTLATTGDATTEASTTTGEPPVDTDTTGNPVDTCTGLAENVCAATPGCLSVTGIWLDDPVCPEVPTNYLGCVEDQGCEQVPTTVCEDGGTFSFLIELTCAPAGFQACRTAATPCTVGCIGLTELQCGFSDPPCTAHYGAPHVVQNDLACADQDALQFLGCGPNLGACSPDPRTVCPAGQPDTAFEIDAGCVPPGHVECGDAMTPACP